MAFVIPHVFKAGEKAVAEHVNENFSYLKQTIEDVNVNLDAKINSTISSTKENLEETLKTYCDEGDAKKVDIGLANSEPNQDFINTSVSWGTPDYTNRIFVGNTSPYTAPCAGVFMGSPQIRYTTVDVFVNDILVYKFYNGTQSYISKDFKITLSKGDVVSYSGPIAGDTYIYSYFYPMKGVN